MRKIRTNEYRNIFPGACSCMTLTSKTGKHYWFRTCDIDTDIWKEGAHVVRQAAGKIIEYGNGKKEAVQYSYVGMTYNSSDIWLLDGINEQGLTGGLLMLYEGTSVDKTETGRIGYVGMELVTKFLSTCKDVEEVITLAEQVQVLNIPVGKKKLSATMHYFFADNSGNEVILEATEKSNPGVLQIYKKEEILGVMTNSPPYRKQLQNLSWFLSESLELRQAMDGQDIMGVKQKKDVQEPVKLKLDGRVIKEDRKAEHISLTGTFPASYSSYDRFIRLCVLKALNDSGNGFEDEKMLALGSGIMNTICEPHTKGVFHYTKIDENGKVIGQKDSFTQYISMYDIEERCFYMKKFDEIIWKKYFCLDFP